MHIVLLEHQQILLDESKNMKTDNSNKEES